MKYIISILLIALLASCKTGKNAKPQDLNTLYKKWELSTIDGKKIKQDSPVYLNFSADKSVNGYLGCNSVNGSYDIKGTSIKFTQLASTRKACMDMSVEQSVMAILNTADEYAFENGKLVLSVGGKEAATFTELIENEITNKYWKLLELDGKSVKMADNQEREQFVMFSNEGIVSGFAGCNHFNGFYKLPEMNQISIDEKISSTLKICPDVDVDESAFLKALTMGSRFQLDNERMILLGRDGKKLAVFEVVYF